LRTKRHYFTCTEVYIYRFQKGHVPANKGHKMSPEQYDKVKHTFFKKGHVSKNKVPVGTVRTRHNYKRNTYYLWIKIAEPGEWEMLHRHNWKKKNVPIPKGLNLVFKDGDQNNCEPENLELITRKEIMQRNTIHNYPEELKETIQALGRYKRKIKTHERRSQDKRDPGSTQNFVRVHGKT